MKVQEILDGIARLRVLVAGDICLDRWCRYDPGLAEPSRETGIPRIAVTATETTPGAAGTVANNVVALGAREVAVLGVIGDDGFGFELKRALERNGISSALAVHSSELPTFTYTKLINTTTSAEDRPRVDFVYTQPVPYGIETQLIDRLRDCWAGYDVVLVSDQAETAQGGIVTERVRSAIGELAAAHRSTVVWVDSRMRGEHFRNVLVKCNVDEANAASMRAFAAIDFARLREHIGDRPLIVTAGGEGAHIFEPAGDRLVPARAVAQPVDICGAGDSFSAGGALALAVTGSPVLAAEFGNRVASITIMKPGTGTASPAEIVRGGEL